MPGTISQTWCSTVDVEPVVIMFSDMEMSSVLSSIVVAMSDEICLEMVMEVVI